MVTAADGAVTVEDGVVVAAGAGEGAAPTEQEAAAEGDKPQGEEKEVDVSQVPPVVAWGSSRESSQIQQLPAQARLMQLHAPGCNEQRG